MKKTRKNAAAAREFSRALSAHMACRDAVPNPQIHTCADLVVKPIVTQVYSRTLNPKIHKAQYRRKSRSAKRQLLRSDQSEVEQRMRIMKVAVGV